MGGANRRGDGAAYLMQLAAWDGRKKDAAPWGGVLILRIQKQLVSAASIKKSALQLDFLAIFEQIFVYKKPLV